MKSIKAIKEYLADCKVALTKGLEPDDELIYEGIIEGLEFVLNKEGEQQSEQPKDFVPVTMAEQMKLGLIADCYLWNNYPKTTNGAYSTSEVTDVVEGILSVIVKYGQQDECHNETNSEYIEVDRAKLNDWNGEGNFEHIIKGQEDE